MDDRPRKILKDLINRYGTSIATDPLRTEGLLRDTCGTCHREIFVLVNAVRQKVPVDLLAPRYSLPFNLLQDFLVKRLRDELSLSEDASRWAVESWADALGLASGTPLPDPEKPMVQKEMTGLSTTITDPVFITRRQQWADDLESMSLETRLKAVQDLSHTPDPENLRLLIGALENGNWQVRESAFDVLYAYGKAAIPALREALSDTNDQVVWRASLLLGALKAHGATGQLIHLLDRKGIIRECAIWSLGEIGNETASTALLKFLQTDDSAVQHEVETALVKIGKT
jgi:HEAT repeat protein